MALPLTLLTLSLSVYQTQALPSNLLSTRRSTIQWGQPCKVESPLAPLECGTLPVPLDYTNTSNPTTISLELLKLPAFKQPSRGSILTHWGGPGPSGREDFVAIGPRIQNITGGYFDLILPVQRGSQDSELLEFKCYANKPGFPASPDFQSAKAADTQSATNWANAEILANDCYAAQNLTGEYLGSAFDARDWMSVVDALGGDGLLRYYGVSAGTTLGNHLVSMFPDRIDKVILDGVVNPHEYVRNREAEVFEDTDKVFSAFCAGCVAAPVNCTLGINTTAADLEAGIKSFVDGLLEDPIPLSFPGVVGGMLVDYQTVKQLIYNTLYYPAQWPGLATQLEVLLTRNSTLIAALLGGPSAAATPSTARTEAQNGIKCSDQDKYSQRSEWEVVQSARHARSYFGDVADVVVGCARWKFDAKERYAGNFTVRTRKPVLLIGNTADPTTPIASARNASAGYEGSVVLEHGSYGHCSHLTQGSLCTAKAIRAYFLDGVLPEPDTKCEVDVPLFSGTGGWDGVVQELGPA